MVIAFKGVEKTFDKATVALTDINFEVQKGDFVVILGPSGSGKTTLIKCINGIETPTKGSIEIKGINLANADKKKLRSQLGVIFQDFNLVENISSLNNVLTGLLFSSNVLLSMLYLFNKQQKLQALDSLNRVGLLTKAHTRVSFLSGGEKQRVGIARAIVKKPTLLLADEPVASLDPVISYTIMKLLWDISKEMGVTVICSLHQVDLAMKFADRIIGLNKGEIVLDETPFEIDKLKIHRIYKKDAIGLA